MANARKRLEAIQKLLAISGWKPKNQGDLDALRAVVEGAVSGVSRLSPHARRILEALQRQEISSGSFPAGQPPTQPPGKTAGGFGQPPRNQLRTRVPQGYPEEQPSFSDEFFTPTSSNVYSFQFFRRQGENNGTLFVTFKASSLNHKALSHGESRHKGGRKQLRGISGHTVGRGRSNAPGPTYQYTGMSNSNEQGVPYRVFVEMKNAYSKGTFVWEVLRGHTKGTPIDYNAGYRYGLVVGQLVGKSAMQYIPRKATNAGFKTRSIADMGTGRRGFTSSTLPPTSNGGGFSTRAPFR